MIEGPSARYMLRAPCSLLLVMLIRAGSCPTGVGVLGVIVSHWPLQRPPGGRRCDDFLVSAGGPTLDPCEWHGVDSATRGRGQRSGLTHVTLHCHPSLSLLSTGEASSLGLLFLILLPQHWRWRMVPRNMQCRRGALHQSGGVRKTSSQSSLSLYKV